MKITCVVHCLPTLSVLCLCILGFNGKDEFDAAQVDMVVGVCADMFTIFVPLFYEEDEERKVIT